MIHPYNNQTQTSWDHGDFKVQIRVPTNSSPIGFCDGTDADLAELQSIAASEGVDEFRMSRKVLKTEREIWTIG